MTDLPDHTQRFETFQRLSSLPVAQLNQVIFTLNPPSGNVASQLTPPAQRVAELLEWVESELGCGLVHCNAPYEVGDMGHIDEIWYYSGS